jgi:glycogen debranching enzyme
MARAEIRPDTRYAWLGPSMLVLDAHGRAGASSALTGYWFREARYARTIAITIDGREPHFCALGSPSHRRIEIVYVHPELAEFGGGGSGASQDRPTYDEEGILHRSLDVRVAHEVSIASLETAITIGNRAPTRQRFVLRAALDADYADLADVLGGTAPAPRAPTRRSSKGDVLELRFAHRELPYRTKIVAPGARADRGGVTWECDLAPREVATYAVRVVPIDFEEPLSAQGVAERLAALEAWRASQVAVELRGSGPAPLVVTQAIDDLRSFPLLEGSRREWLALQAGIPLYPALFGRDTLTAGWHASFLDGGAVLDASLARLGRMQSHRFREWTDEEPGRIPYQVRRGPQSRLGLVPYSAYYADFASPLMFVVSMVQLFAWTGDEKKILPHLEVARRILDWAREHGDRDGDGYLEYLTKSPKGTKNQAWKDSGDAIVDADGRQVPAPIAACEIQGYWFAAQELLAIMLWLRGERDEARAWWRSARELKERFERDFWMEDEGYYALALGPDKRQVKSVTSNVGHCIAAGIVGRERLPRVVDRMFAPDMFGGWGIRTLSARHPSYNPLSYHNGSVWSVENATIAFGLRRFGMDERALELADATFDLASRYPDGRIPECVGGYDRSEFSHPGAYPQANAPQTWNASAIPSFLHSMLGLLPVASLDLLVVDPVLASALAEVRLEGLRVGGARVDMVFHRDRDGRSRYDVLRKEGTLHVVRQPPPESISIGLAGRFRALVEGLVAA